MSSALSATDVLGTIDFDHIESKAGAFGGSYATADPWRHVVIDDFFYKRVAQAASERFPKLSRFDNTLARLLEARTHNSQIERADQIFEAIYADLFSSRFCSWLEDVTGIANLSPDRELIGAGFHQGARGSYLRLHADHNTHPKDRTQFRRVSLLVYMNREWMPQWRGDLELWDREARACVTTIQPRFNRCLLMEVSDTAFHGYANLRPPQNVTRNALAAYYYSSDPAVSQRRKAHRTVLPRVNGESQLAYLSHAIRRIALSQIRRMKI